MKKALILLAALMVSACAWTEDTVAIPRPSIPVAAVPGAERISVTVVSADARQELEVSHKKNGYGMRGAMTVLLRQIADDPQLTRALTQAGSDYMPGVPGRDPNVRS